MKAGARAPKAQGGTDGFSESELKKAIAAEIGAPRAGADADYFAYADSFAGADSIADANPVNDESDPREIFLRQILIIIRMCHTHNISACVKRIETATRLFAASCVFDPRLDALIRESVERLSAGLGRVRYAELIGKKEAKRIKEGCVIWVRQLHQLVYCVRLRAHDEPPYAANDARAKGKSVADLAENREPLKKTA